MDVHPTKNGINRYWSIPTCGSGASAATIPGTDGPTEGTGGGNAKAVTTSAQPGLHRDIKSKRILESQPTLHYEGEEETNPAKKKQATASKAKPKPPQDAGQEKKQKNATRTPDAKALPKPTRATSPKIEVTTPDPTTASAVQQSLNRAPTFVEAQQLAYQSSESDSEENGGGGDPDPNVPTAEQVAAKKRAHARYMRFFRSTRSTMALLSIIQCHVISVFSLHC